MIIYFEPQHQASSAAQVLVLLWALPPAAKDLKSPKHFRLAEPTDGWAGPEKETWLILHSTVIRLLSLEGRQEGLVGTCWFFRSSAAAVRHVKEPFCLSLPTLLSGYSTTYLVGCFHLLTLSQLWWMLGGLCQAVLCKGKMLLLWVKHFSLWPIISTLSPEHGTSQHLACLTKAGVQGVLQWCLWVGVKRSKLDTCIKINRATCSDGLPSWRKDVWRVFPSKDCSKPGAKRVAAASLTRE